MTRIPEKVDVVVVGGGQAGIAASEHLSLNGLSHVVLEKDRIAESWRTRRWDSLVANGPAWHDKFPGLNFECNSDEFAPKDSVVEYMEKYAKKIKMPIYSGVTVSYVEPLEKKMGFTVETSDGQQIKCTYIIAATGSFQVPVIPSVVPNNLGIQQIHSNSYKSPGKLPAGNVLVVGAGSSGAQIADELSMVGDGRRVFLSVGEHERPPRSYRDRDFCWWLGVLNNWDVEATPTSSHTTIAVSGARGGETMDFRRLCSQGVTLLGRTESYSDGKLKIRDDLKANIEHGDANYLSVLDDADAYIETNGLDLPEEPSARQFLPDPPSLSHPILELDLKANEITTIIWATGFSNEYGWLKSTKAIDVSGSPSHRRGISTEPGIYFLGLPWQTRRGSSFIWGVWHDAKNVVVEHIAKHNGYMKYTPSKA